ncbi:uncharacterized protein EDB91DRAFT_1081114 [Suillus paluster]|uniref:uncharacterized protein n=1 Tax=Suillus paluster TaxID=48578 RepID=UPI001B875F90|nr:uncharacterized protein EDB91DRAFT_1081114 [Suillus paluster]KAG1743746.1 hypothetical protein EDB91DRAFT_1081114 [Suillus paluster]
MGGVGDEFWLDHSSAGFLVVWPALIFNAVYKELNITIVHGGVIHSLLLGTAHLNTISGYVEVPDLDTHTLATGATKMLGIIAICAAAIERALGMFANKNLKVKDILASSARGKLVIKLLKVLNKVTRKMINALFLFSAARWAKVTTSFIKSISSKPAGTHLMTTSRRTISALCFDVVSSTPLVESRCRIIIFATVFSPTCPPFFLYPQLALNFLH